MVPAPIALGLTLCETVIVDASTFHASLINTFNSMRAPSFPFAPLPFHALTTLTGGQGEAEVTLVVTHTQTDEEIASMMRRLVVADRFHEVRAQFRLDTIVFPSPGTYIFTLLVDDDWVAHRRLRILQ